MEGSEDIDPSSFSKANKEVHQKETDRLANLRSLAQQHLDEIDDMARKEEVQEKKRVAELEIENMRRGGKQAVNPYQQVGGKGSRLRTAQDVLDRLRWDPSLKIEQHCVGYLDRFGGVQELPVSDWIRESTDEEWIPQHRIRYIKRKGDGLDDEEVVWHRDERIDKIFGSS